MKKIFSLGLGVVLALTLFAGCGGRVDKYADALRIGTTAMPKNLNPYASTEASATFFVSLFYDTLLGTALTPADYVEGETYQFPDGSVYTPVDPARNPLSFTDGLVEAIGALPKEDGSLYGYEYFDPTPEQWAEQCRRENIVFGWDESGNPISETEEAFLERALIAVPNTNWMRFRFKVVEGYTWNDGTPFTAEDIRFTFEYILKHAGALGSQAYFLADYHSSTVVDGDLELILATGNYTAMKTICNSIVIIPKHIWQTVRQPAKEKNLFPVGTGPYEILEGDYLEGSSITATLRKDLRAERKSAIFTGTPIQTISVILMSNEDILINALNQGNVDLMLNTVTAAKAHAVAENPSYNNVKISAVPSESVSTLLFNLGPYGAFGEGGYPYQVRKAISLCIDQEALITDVLHGMGVPVGDGLVQDYFDHAYVDADGNYVYHVTDVEAANALLDTTPYQMDETGSRGITLSVLATPDKEVTVKALAAQLKAIGITLEYQQAAATYAEEIKQQNNADFDTIINRVTYSPDKLLMFSARYGVYPGTETVRLFNYAGLVDETLIAMMEEMELASDPTDQYARSRDVQAYLADLAVEIPLYAEKTITLYSTGKWEGWVEAQGQSIWNDFTLRYLHQVEGG